jgi:hypothetical protein
MSQDYNYAISTTDLLPVPGNTPFGYYDNDPTFQNDAQRACFYVHWLTIGFHIGLQKL